MSVLVDIYDIGTILSFIATLALVYPAWKITSLLKNGISKYIRPAVFLFLPIVMFVQVLRQFDIIELPMGTIAFLMMFFFIGLLIVNMQILTGLRKVLGKNK